MARTTARPPPTDPVDPAQPPARIDLSQAGTVRPVVRAQARAACPPQQMARASAGVGSTPGPSSQ